MEKPDLQPVEADAGDREQQWSGQRLHKDAAQCQEGGNAQAKDGAGEEESIGPGLPEVSPLVQQIDAGLRAKDERREGQGLELRELS